MAECLRRINRPNGYQTDAGLAVTLEPGQADDNAAAFIAVVIAAQARASDAAVRATHRLTTVGVVAKVPAQQGDAQAALDAIVDDVERCMRDQQFRFPVGIEFPRYLDMQPIKPDAGMGWIGALVQYQTHIPII
jgi:hypothetical protein